jgi:hypothetical protein
VDQILGPPKAPATRIYLTVDPFGLSRKVTTTILTDAPERRIRTRMSCADRADDHALNVRFWARPSAGIRAVAAPLAWPSAALGRRCPIGSLTGF